MTVQLESIANAAPTTEPIPPERIALRAKLEAALPHFTGREVFFTGREEFTRHMSMIATQGAMYVAETAGAYWLLDLIWSYQGKLARKVSAFSGQPGIEFQVWTLTVDVAAREGVIRCREDSEGKVLVTQKLEFTDFPLPEFVLWVEGKTILLPSEH